ncbi:MAG: tryptophan transporter [Bacillus sp. (in: firmicutes)]
MKTKVLVILSLLVGIGAVLHTVVPGVFMGIKPDLMLTMMFLGIILFPDKKNVVLLGIVTGVIALMTTSFPGGQIPNLLDKIVSAFIFYGLLMMAKKYTQRIITLAILTAAGTIVSGVIFLGSALFIAGLPAPFLILFATVVLPTALLNTIVMIIVHPIVAGIMRRSNFTVSA